MTMEVRRYIPELAADWAHVLSHARNGIFQFERNFMEYHGDRFVDMSAIVYVDDKPVGLIAAAYEAASQRVVSHPGLTFGGVVLARQVRTGDGIAVVNAVLDAFKRWGARTCLMKLVPSVFCRYPSAEVDYALWLRGFALVRRDLSSLLPLNSALPFNSLKLRSIKRAQKVGIHVAEASVSHFHALLESVLLAQHGVLPVHSVDELKLLKARFPEDMIIRAAWLGDELLAGALVFNYQRVWHTQYLANSSRGREVGALDLVISSLISEAQSAEVSYFSFGTSTTEAGRELNSGLLWQKESYGARAMVHDFMEGVL